MRTSVLQENLFKALTIVKPAATGLYSLPVLNNVHLNASNGRLRLTATDLELSISVWVGAKVEMEGETTIPLKTAHELVKSLSKERVDLEMDRIMLNNIPTEVLNLQCGGAKVQLKGVSACEFPIINPVGGKQIAISGETLRDAIDEVLASASREDNRPVLTGVYFNIDGETITLASADGYRLTVRKVQFDGGLDQPLTMVIPARALQQVSKNVGKGKKSVDVVYINIANDGETVSFDLDHVLITSNLISGTFPEYERIVPKSHLTTTIVYREELHNALNRSKVFAKDSSNTLNLTINPASDGYVGTMKLFAQSSEFGQCESLLDAHVDGVAIKTAFNVMYLIDVCKTLADDQLIIQTSEVGDPAVIRGVGREDFYYVIMPMQISQ